MTYQADSESVYSLDSTSVPASPLSVVSPIVGTKLAKTVNQTDKHSQSEGTISLIFIDLNTGDKWWYMWVLCIVDVGGEWGHQSAGSGWQQ